MVGSQNSKMDDTAQAVKDLSFIIINSRTYKETDIIFFRQYDDTESIFGAVC